jgi:hypothetical protein
MGISPVPCYIPVNDDDDDGDGWMDKANGGNLEPGNPLAQGQDDDLVQFDLSVTAPYTYYSDKVELAHFQDLTKLRVWGQRNRTNLILTDAPGYYSKKWTPGYQTTPIYVEGRAASSGYQSSDPFLRWQYWGNNSDALTGWNPDFWVTVVHVDMDMDGVKDEEYSGPDAGKTEETTPGGFIPLGGFVKVTVKHVDGTTLNPYVRLTAPDGGSKIEVWNTGKTQVIPFGTDFATNNQLPMDVWVKGLQVSGSVRDVTLALNCTLGGTTFQDKIKLTVVDLEVNPTSGPIGTVVTLRLHPSGTGLLSDDSTASLTGHYVPQGYSPTSETTIAYPAGKVYYNPPAPDEVKVVVGDVQPDSFWLLSNPQVYMASSGSLVGDISLQTGVRTLAWARQFQLYSQDELGTLEGTTFTPVDLVASGQVLIAQVLIKDDGLGSPPDLLTLTIQSYDAAGNLITAPPTQDYADSSVIIDANRVTTGGVPGFHTYRSSPDEPIMPYAFELPLGLTLDGNKFIYIVSEGSLRMRY